MHSTLHRLRGTLEVDSTSGYFLGDTRIRLLEAIEQHGSISQAAKAVPLSYKAAWDAVDAMNNLAQAPLVIRCTGGKHGGGTLLTDYGRKVVALYRALENEYQAALDRLSSGMHSGQASDIQQFQQLLRRMSMTTSARNQFAGQVVGLREGLVDFEVRLKIDNDLEIVAVITGESAQTLQLREGTEVHAIIKSSSVLLLNESNVQTSARNQMWGEIARIHDGPVNAEVTIALPSERSLCAVVTHESIERMGLAVGSRVGAAFKASAVILCKYA